MSNEPSHEKEQQFGFPTRSDTNWPVLSQKQARRLKFQSEEGERLYYPCDENKDADQLCSYYTADQLLCFRYASFWFSYAAAQIIFGYFRNWFSDNTSFKTTIIIKWFNESYI